MRFRAVDATTREPLSGVNAMWTQVGYGMFQQTKQEGPTNLPPSGQNGIIIVQGLRAPVSGLHNWHSYFIFSCSGFSNVYGTYEGPPLGLGERKRNFDLHGALKDAFFLEGHLTSIFPSNGCFLVPMRR
jgi:hypothetical protein